MKPRVLLVDDEADFRQLLEYNLARQNFEVFTAANGLEALNQARRLLPDAILLDLMLPDLDGLSVRQILRAQPSTAHVPVIIVSALTGLPFDRNPGDPGIACFLRKPVQLDSLGECVRRIIEQQQDHHRARMLQES